MAKTRHKVLSRSQNSILLEPPLACSWRIPQAILSSIVVNDSIETVVKTKKLQVKILRRRNLLSRFEKVEKRIGANIDHLFLVVANFPPFNLMNYANMALKARSQNIPFTVLINKSDRSDTTESFQRKVEALIPYTFRDDDPDGKLQKGIQVSIYDEHLMSNLKSEIKKIANTCKGSEMSIFFIGQSGVGKSSIINALIPSAGQKTGLVSTRYKKGKHTTRHSRSFEFKLVEHYKQKIYLLDTPGIDSFGAEDLKKQEILKYFSEWDEISQKNFFCRFNNCQHMQEPNCGIRKFLESLEQDGDNFNHLTSRLKLWKTLMRDLNKKTLKNNQS